ncbi:unnamed protein product [Cuscuta epithymum]|uniref:Uncharacterized protein n=1 Tax=Cuscuta epithymum TaxID=186058 RepID=A0AAV0CHE9_9ASTE|nr:unnamed protein product [Cuscuta epithymum]
MDFEIRPGWERFWRSCLLQGLAKGFSSKKESKGESLGTEGRKRSWSGGWDACRTVKPRRKRTSVAQQTAASCQQPECFHRPINFRRIGTIVIPLIVHLRPSEREEDQ